MHLFDLLHQKIELFRLEQRYTRRRNRRCTFVSEAQYVDGEYIYSPTSTFSKNHTGNSNSDCDETQDFVGKEATSKANKRRSMMNLGKMDWKIGGGGRADKRQSRVSVTEVKWDESVNSR